MLSRMYTGGGDTYRPHLDLKTQNPTEDTYRPRLVSGSPEANWPNRAFFTVFCPMTFWIF